MIPHGLRGGGGVMGTLKPPDAKFRAEREVSGTAGGGARGEPELRAVSCSGNHVSHAAGSDQSRVGPGGSGRPKSCGPKHGRHSCGPGSPDGPPEGKVLAPSLNSS